jgi:GNAT superfamily N-acetyltransferase
LIKIAHESLLNVKAALNQGKIKLNPNWKEYANLDVAGILRIFTARDDGELVGYFVLMVSQSIHYQDHLFANNDVLFVLPDSRAGATGYKLIKFAEDHCREAGVSLMMINTKVHIPFDSLMIGMGFDLIERIYSKFLGK